jgi:myosin protein heavy chain
LDRQLANALARTQEFEDTMLQLEREKATHDRQMEAARMQLDTESARNAKLDAQVSSQKAELIRVRDRAAKLDRELNKALTDLKHREWEVTQLESKQDKTIVEHVHVLEEAKRVTDRQLAEAQTELQKNATYIRSLEKSKTRLAGEVEDLARQAEREGVDLRSKEKAARSLEEKTSKALAEAEAARRAREFSEQQSRRIQSELQKAHEQNQDLSAEILAVQRSKDNLEMELMRLADETDSSNSLAKIQRDYESRISQLEESLHEAESSKVAASKIKEQVDRHHADIRRLIMSDVPSDDAFRSRLLRELQVADEQLQGEMASRSRHMRTSAASELRTMANLTPTKRAADGTRQRLGASEVSRAADAQVSALKQQVQILELQMAASDRVRRHLETSIREMTSDLENSDGSKQFLQQYRARLSRENARLKELLDDEAKARRASESAQIDGVQAMWKKFQDRMTEERESYSRLEESRKALVSFALISISCYLKAYQLVQQRTAQGELDDHRRQLRELAQSRKQAQSELAQTKDQLNAEIASKNQEISS